MTVTHTGIPAPRSRSTSTRRFSSWLASTMSGFRSAMAARSGFLVPRTRRTSRPAGRVHHAVAPTSASGRVTATDSVSDGTSDTTRRAGCSTGTGYPRSSCCSMALGGCANDEGVSLATAAAQGGDADSPAAAAEFQREREDQPGAAHADWMAKGDGAAVNVHPVQAQPEVPRRGEGDPGEGLVDFDQVQVTEGQGAVAAQGIADRASRLVQQRGVRSGDGAVAADLGKPGHALAFRALLAHDDDGACAVRELGGGA